MIRQQIRLAKTMDKLARAYADMIFSATALEEEHKIQLRNRPQIEPSTTLKSILLSSPKAHKNINKDMLFGRKGLYRDIQIVKSFEELRGLKVGSYDISKNIISKIEEPSIEHQSKLDKDKLGLTADEADLDYFLSLVATIAMRLPGISKNITTNKLYVSDNKP
jgi:hypothetical protein